MQTRGPAESPNAFLRGLQYALADDGAVGPNDAPALQALAAEAGVSPFLVDFLETEGPRKPEPTERNLPFARKVVDFKPGPGGGFHGDNLAVALGTPEGAGNASGSLDVVSLGQGGQITLQLGRPALHGITVFENGFGETNGVVLNPEPARVEVSTNGVSWKELKGEAGLRSVEANSTNGIDPAAPEAGGDRFFFEDSGIPPGRAVRYVRITDLSQPGPAEAMPGSGTAGFDLDAVHGF